MAKHQKVADPNVISENSVLEDMRIDTSDLIREMAEQPSLFAHYSFVCARTQDDAARLKFELETLTAELNTAVREQMDAKKQRIRESAVKAGITSNEGWQEVNVRYMDAKQNQAILETAVEAFKMRAHMLSSIGALTRVEMEQNGSLGTPMTRTDPDKANAVLRGRFNKLVEERRKKS